MGRNDKFKDDHFKFTKELTSKGYAIEHQQLLNQVVAGTYHIMVYLPSQQTWENMLYLIIVQNIMVYKLTKNFTWTRFN